MAFSYTDADFTSGSTITHTAVNQKFTDIATHINTTKLSGDEFNLKTIQPSQLSKSNTHMAVSFPFCGDATGFNGNMYLPLPLINVGETWTCIYYACAGNAHVGEAAQPVVIKFGQLDNSGSGAPAFTDGNTIATLAATVFAASGTSTATVTRSANLIPCIEVAFTIAFFNAATEFGNYSFLLERQFNVR